MPNPTKQSLLHHFARIGRAMASPGRLELLNLLAQGEKTVEMLAAQSGLTVKNTSAHLRTLKSASLVLTRREGAYVHYRLGDAAVHDLLRCIQEIARGQLAEVRELVADFFSEPEGFEPLAPEELMTRLERGEVTLLDVRPEDEYRAAHIAGAVSLPLRDLRARIADLPAGRDVVAYCRGPYCVLSVEAAAALRTHGYRARRLEIGMPDWQRLGLPVETGLPGLRGSPGA